MTTQCEYCYEVATWKAVTPSNEDRSVCQRHYDEILSARKVGRFENLSEDLLDMIRGTR